MIFSGADRLPGGPGKSPMKSPQGYQSKHSGKRERSGGASHVEKKDAAVCKIFQSEKFSWEIWKRGKGVVNR